MTAVLVAGVLGAYFDVRSKLDDIGRIVITDTSHRPPRYTDAVNLLLLGSDSRSGRNARIGGRIGCDCSDTIMIAHISPGRGRVTVLSIPRDTVVPLYTCTATQGTPGQQADPNAFERINATLEAGGPECVRTTVEQQTGIYINNTISMNFTGFQQVVNDVHGVTVCVPVAIDDPITPGPDGHGSGLKLSAGKHHIYGRTALEFWRARYALADGSDLARINRDQYLMGQIFKGILHSGLLSSPTTLYRVFGDVAKSISTDASISDLVGIAASLRHVSSANIQFVTAPTVPYPADPLAELELDPAHAPAVFAAIARDKTLPKTPKHKKGKHPVATTLTVKPSLIKVNVLNGTLIQGLAAKVATELTTSGFTVVGTPSDATRSNFVHTVVEYSQPTDKPEAITLARQITSARVKQKHGVTAGTVQLILGSTFTTVVATSQPLHSIAGSFKASSSCRNSAFFGTNLPAPTVGHVSCAC
jgi:LCP family protein required for cell wall assembly